MLDAYEVLRQLVDATDDLRGAFIAVTLPPELVTDDARGLPAYSALHLRVVDEVRDRRRANPFAALVRLETRLEVVRRDLEPARGAARGRGSAFRGAQP